jgi:hypothetical protein
VTIDYLIAPGGAGVAPDLNRDLLTLIFDLSFERFKVLLRVVWEAVWKWRRFDEIRIDLQSAATLKLSA